MRNPLPKVTLVLLAASAIAAAPAVSRVVGDLRIIPVSTALGEGAATISKLDGTRTGYYYDLGERAGQLRPKARNVVLLGLGGGEMLRAARRSLPAAELLGVDNDQVMIRAALDEFRIGDFGAKAQLADAFAYVKRVRNVDVLLVDLFVGDAMPQGMLNTLFWLDCRKSLAKGGLVAVNVYPARMVPAVRGLLASASLSVLEEHEVRGSTVIFAAP